MDTTKADKLLTPFPKGPFRFDCGKEIACFTKCCAKLRLILTPYDILRIKKRLSLSSSQFLEQFTDILLHEHRRFPLVKLNMLEGRNQRCPFVTDVGCAIYEDRPGACRLYPIARASTTIEAGERHLERYFIVNEAHCLGFEEKKEWTLDQWLSNEGVKEYSEMNDRWLEILNSRKSLGSASFLTQKHKMFFMASYDLDRFRKFVLEGRLFSLFDIDPDRKAAMASDDVSLMLFAFDWLKFSLFGEKTLTVSPS